MIDMKPDADYIHALMIEKMAGSISEPEGKYLDDLIEKDPYIKQVYNKLRSRFAESDLENNFQRIKTDFQWQDITASIQEKERPRVIVMRRIAWAAAIMGGIFVGGYYWLYQQQTHKPAQEALAKTDNKKAIQLQLPGGKTIDLSANKGQVSVGATTLNNAGKTLSYTTNDNDGPIAGENILRVPIGLDYKIALSDGTEVWLNSATTLRFPFNFTGNTREITLNGEAYLVVAKNTGKPFIVHTPNSTIQVLGTQFNVNTYDAGSVRVALVEGAVKVKASQEQVTIKPGQEAVYSTQQARIAIGSFNEDEVLSWREGIHYFHNATIREICNVFPRWYGIDITIDNKTLDNKRFSGILNRNEPLEKFLGTLKATTAINEYYMDRSGLLHVK